MTVISWFPSLRLAAFVLFDAFVVTFGVYELAAGLRGCDVAPAPAVQHIHYREQPPLHFRSNPPVYILENSDGIIVCLGYPDEGNCNVVVPYPWPVSK